MRPLKMKGFWVRSAKWASRSEFSCLGGGQRQPVRAVSFRKLYLLMIILGVSGQAPAC